MKKSLIALLLVVALVVTVSVFAASAETTNPFEGQTGDVTAVCPACGTEQTWKAVTSANASSSIQHWPGASTGTTHFYYAENITCKSGTILTTEKFCVNLNGKTITRAKASGSTALRFFTIKGTDAENAPVLNLMDTSVGETGKMVIPMSGEGFFQVAYESVCGTVNVYSGTYFGSGVEGGTSDSSGTLINCLDLKDANKNVVDRGGTAHFNFYGGTLKGASKYSCGLMNLKDGTTVTIDGATLDGKCGGKTGGVCVLAHDAKMYLKSGSLTGGLFSTAAGWGSTVKVLNNAEFEMSGGTLTGASNGYKGGALYMSGTGDATINGDAKIIGGKATNSNGGNIAWESSGTLTIGGKAQITGGTAKVGGNIAIAKGTVNITGPDVKISGGSGTGSDIRITSATLNLTDVSLRHKTVHQTSVSAGGSAKVNVAGSTVLDRINIESGITTAKVLIKEGYTGSTYIGWSTASQGDDIINTPGATTDPVLWQEVGYKGTGNIYGVNSDRSSKILVDTGDATGTDNKFVTAIAAGVKLDAEGKETKTPLVAMPTDATAYDYVVPYYNGEYTLACDTVLDNNNSAINVITNGFKLGLIENRSNEFSDEKSAGSGDMTGYVTVDDVTKLQAVTQVKGNNYQYVTLPFGQGYTARRVSVDIDSVNIKPATAGLYYTTSMNTSPLATGKVTSYGVVLSLVDMPGADFVSEDGNGDDIVDNLYTEIDFTPVAGEPLSIQGANSALLVGILNQGAPEGQNDAWGTKPIYANAFVCFNIDGKNVYVMADKTYELSLKDIMVLVDGNKDLASHASVVKMYETWQDPLAQWELTNIKAAYDAANA